VGLNLKTSMALNGRREVILAIYLRGLNALNMRICEDSILKEGCYYRLWMRIKCRREEGEHSIEPEEAIMDHPQNIRTPDHNYFKARSTSTTTTSTTFQ